MFLVRLLDFVEFFLPILPEVEFPVENISIDEKIVYTVAGGIIFLLSQLPIYGLVSDAYLKINDPFYFQRTIFAMEKGTLLELGLLPILTSAFVWQLGAGLKLINVNLSLRSDRELFQSGQKLTSFALAIVYGAGFIFSGYYNNVIKGFNTFNGDSVPISTLVLIFLQIVTMSFLTTLMVEIFDKGYSFGSGILCFIALQVATNLIRDLIGLEIVSLPNSNKFESYGAAVNFIKNFKINLKGLNYNVLNSFTRSQLPNLTQFYIVLATVLFLIGIQNYRIELPIRSTKVRGMNNVFPIRLFYTGALPILFAFTVLANLQVFGYFTSTLLRDYSQLAASIIGTWSLDKSSFNLNLTSGILYFLTPSKTLGQTLLSPLRSIAYGLAIIALSTWFADKWSKISGSSPKDISKQFKDQGISISGKRDISITKELSRVIPVASVSGAFVLAVLALVGEYLGGLGKGVGAIIGVCGAFGVLEEFMIEYQQAGGNSQLTSVFRQ